MLINNYHLVKTLPNKYLEIVNNLNNLNNM